MYAVVSHIDELTLVSVEGPLDAAASKEARGLFGSLLDQGHQRMVVDLAAVDFIDSSGLGVLVGLLKKIRASEGELRIAGVSPSLMSIFELTQVDRVFNLYDTADAALAA